MAINSAGTIAITVCYAHCGQAWQQQLNVSVGSTVAQTIAASDFGQAFPSVDPWQCGVGVFSHLVQPSDKVQQDDRIEIYRPLVFDPMTSRRRRAARRRQQSATTVVSGRSVPGA
jgi:putative ubiquitin-RnfH superfamily antitoxin RatB of RatAB toxin-antitoxin module